MQVFSQAIHVDGGQPLGGYAGERLSSVPFDNLELNGLSFDDDISGQRIELCTVDALYAGELVEHTPHDGCQRIFAASHTHYAPMLDARKPQLGMVAEQALRAWWAALRTAPRRTVNPNRCTILRTEVPVPIYRRFDVPDSPVNRLLTGHAGMFPNPAQPVDRNLYLFEFGTNNLTNFVIILHACHPVSRADRERTSPDYVGILRSSVRKRFGDVPCLFLLGCSGDIRPNLARKRIRWLPRGRLNWRFEWPVHPASEHKTDEAYARAVEQARPWLSFDLQPNGLHYETCSLPLVHQGPMELPVLRIGDHLRFEFVPFEVSHLFHLDAQKKDPMRFIVSCADRTIGYLPHPRQITAGGYEVDGSREIMGLKRRVLIEPEAA